MINAEILESILSYVTRSDNTNRLVYPNEIVFCTRTSMSKKPKPIVNNVYICRKTVETKWGSKAILVDATGEEVWGDLENIVALPRHIVLKFNESDIENLKEKLHEVIMNDYMPVIAEVIKKNSAGIEVILSTGQRLFISKKIIYPIEMYRQANTKDIIEINIPVWFAQTNKIIETE